jgi:hypothetical protein
VDTYIPGMRAVLCCFLITHLLTKKVEDTPHSKLVLCIEVPARERTNTCLLEIDTNVVDYTHTCSICCIGFLLPPH